MNNNLIPQNNTITSTIYNKQLQYYFFYQYQNYLSNPTNFHYFYSNLITIYKNNCKKLLEKYGFNEPYTLKNTPEFLEDKGQFGILKEKTYKITYKKLSVEEEKEANLWLLNRKRNYPTRERVREKEETGEKKVHKGLLSKLELKLMKKVNILKKIENKRNKNKGKERQKTRLKTEAANDSATKNKAEEEIEEGEIKENAGKNAFSNNKSGIEINRRDKKKKRNDERLNKYKFRYIQNNLYNNLIKNEVIQEENIILQAFRYFIEEKMIE